MSAPGSVDAVRYARALVGFAVFLALALVVAGWGILSLLTERDVISRPGTPLVAGLLMAGVPLVGAAVALWILGGRLAEGRRVPAVTVGMLFAVLAVALYGGLGWVVFDLGLLDTFLGPFAWWLGIVLGVVWILYRATLLRRLGGSGRPRWPWEERDEP